MEEELTVEGGGSTYIIYPDKPGTYYFEIRDAMDEVLYPEINVTYRQLVIAREPKDGSLTFDQGYDLRVEMADGTRPFTYELYHIQPNMAQMGWEISERYGVSDKNTFNVTEAGDYYFIITDAEGEWARSRTARVEPYGMKVIDYSKDVTIEESTIENDRYLHGVKDLWAEIEGGTPPYIFEWYWYCSSENAYLELEKNKSSNGFDRLRVELPGKHVLKVTDKHGTSTQIDINVAYTGTRPFITVQPQNMVIENKVGMNPSGELSCEAMTSDGTDRNVVYEWYERYMADGNSVHNYAGNGRKLTLNGISTSGYYYCLAGNSRSRNAIVEVEMRLKQCVFTQEPGKNRYGVYIEITGGMPPYDVYRFDGFNAYRGKIEIGAEAEGLLILMDNIDKRATFYQIKVVDGFGYEYVFNLSEYLSD